MLRSFSCAVPSLRAPAALALVALLVSAPVACSDDPVGAAAPDVTDDDGGSRKDGGGATDGDGGSEVPSSCPRAPKPDDHARKIVVSHPFQDAPGKAKLFEVLELSADGALSKTGQTFEMRAAYQDVVFTPDGKVGFVAQDDGTIGVFSFDDAGKVKVVHEAFAPNEGASWSAGKLVVSKDGQVLYVLDPNVEKNGGGVRRMKIACDGTLQDEGLVVTGGTAHQMALFPGDPNRAVLVSYKAGDSPAGSYAHTLDLSVSPPKRLASGAVFGDEDAIASSVVVTQDGKFALVTDDGFAKGSRMAAVALSDMTKRATLDTPSPSGVALSPFGNALLLMNSNGDDALRSVRYDPSNDAAPFTVGALIATKGGKTELPTHAKVIERGTLKGRVLVSEVQLLRQLAFASDGTITDVDKGLSFKAAGSPGIVGSFGIEP